MDLTDKQWALIEPLFETKRRADGRGRPWRNPRDVLNGVLCTPAKRSATVVRLLLHHAREAGLDPTFPAFADALFQRGLAAHFGAEDVAALVKVLRGFAKNDALA